MVGFIAKVIGLSVVLAIAIKYGGPLLPVTGTTVNVLIAVLLPTVVMAGILAWRATTGGKKGTIDQEG